VGLLGSAGCSGMMIAALFDVRCRKSLLLLLLLLLLLV